jgi:hypothetical protein
LVWKKVFKGIWGKNCLKRNKLITIMNSTPEQKEYWKQQREKHKEQRHDYAKQYYQQHKETELEKTKQWKANNIDKLTAKIQCGCGGKFQYRTKAEHERSKKHQTYINNIH